MTPSLEINECLKRIAACREQLEKIEANDELSPKHKHYQALEMKHNIKEAKLTIMEITTRL